jgi:hypothetical protein
LRATGSAWRYIPKESPAKGASVHIQKSVPTTSTTEASAFTGSRCKRITRASG